MGVGRTRVVSGPTAARSAAASRPVPLWAVASSIAAPCVLILGWTLAARAQPGRFDSVSGTISALADYPATDRWIMTGALVATGVCHLITARGLCLPGTGARRALTIGGGATIAVAVVPLSSIGALHALCAAVSFGALAFWPVLARRSMLIQGRGTSLWMTFFLLLVVCVVVSQPSGRVGLVERVLAGGECLWPAAVALSLARHTAISR
jgi:hypothetical membrane protein